jgi:hypothetical protein
MLFASVAIAALSTIAPPSPSPTPLKVIGHAATSAVCTAVRENLAPTIVGLRVNDGLIGQGEALMGKIAYDAIAEPNNGAMGGVGAASAMDDVQLSQLVHALAQNLTRVENLLNDARRFPAQPSNDDERALQLARARLQAVADEQSRALRIMSGTMDADEMWDLESRCDPADCGATRDSYMGPMSGGAGSRVPARLPLPRLLALEIRETQSVENLVTAPVVDVANRCRP